MSRQEMDASLIEMLSTLDIEGVAVTATVDQSGKLGKIGGLWEKLGKQTVDLAHRGLLHTVVVAAEQDNVEEAYLREDAEPLRVIKASTVADALRKLNEASLPRRAVLQKVLQECDKLELLGWKQVSMETLYQELPLLLQVKREKLPRFERERDEHAESDEEEEVGWRTTELLRWEEEMLHEQVTYERHELTELFDDFHRVAKDAT